MTTISGRRKQKGWRAGWLGLGTSVLVGCGSPPSVVPVLRSVGQTLMQEAERIETVEGVRDGLYLDRVRADLREAYRADLASSTSLTVRWVDEATTVYVAAREALLRQELEQAASRATRAENLRLAARAQARAVAVLEQQDRLLMDTLGVDLWRIDLDRTMAEDSE
ncbi:MAG: hypothetical protein AAGG38_04205 [Planctomycetota bacterium]